MKIKTEYVAKDLATAIINDDMTGLNDDESREVLDWCSTAYMTPHGSGYEEKFTRCAITGLMADCVLVDLVEYTDLEKGEQ